MTPNVDKLAREIEIDRLVGQLYQHVRLHCGEKVLLGHPEAKFIAQFILDREAALQSRVREMEAELKQYKYPVTSWSEKEKSYMSRITELEELLIDVRYHRKLVSAQPCRCYLCAEHASLIEKLLPPTPTKGAL